MTLNKDVCTLCSAFGVHLGRIWDPLLNRAGKVGWVARSGLSLQFSFSGGNFCVIGVMVLHLRGLIGQGVS